MCSNGRLVAVPPPEIGALIETTAAGSWALAARCAANQCLPHQQKTLSGHACARCAHGLRSLNARLRSNETAARTGWGGGPRPGSWGRPGAGPGAVPRSGLEPGGRAGGGRGGGPLSGGCLFRGTRSARVAGEDRAARGRGGTRGRFKSEDCWINGSGGRRSAGSCYAFPRCVVGGSPAAARPAPVARPGSDPRSGRAEFPPAAVGAARRSLRPTCRPGGGAGRRSPPPCWHSAEMDGNRWLSSARWPRRFGLLRSRRRTGRSRGDGRRRRRR